MVVLHTCNNEEDPIINEDARALTRLYVIFFRCSRAAYSKVSGGILSKFELVQAFIVVLITCKNEEDPIKNEGGRVLTSLLQSLVESGLLGTPPGYYGCPRYLQE